MLHTNLSDFLSNKPLRKLYFNTVNISRKLSKLHGTIWFLSQCLEENLIPKTFRIKNKPHQRESSPNQNWESSAQQTSLDFVKIALDQEKEKLTTLQEDFSSNINVLKLLTENEKVTEDVKEKLVEKYEELKIKELKIKEKKIRNLRSNNLKKRDPVSKSPKKRKFEKRSKYKRRMKKKKRERPSVVFNFSDHPLSEDMISLLNRGLNFAVMPDKLNLSQVLCEFRKFERTMLWTEFWASKEDQDETEYKRPMFKTEKTNLPRKHPAPAELKTFLNGARSEISDPENINKNCRPNLPPNELKALKELINLQKFRKIIIKPADKGAGICVLNFEDYISSCKDHLDSKQKQTDGTSEPYYEKVDEKHLKKAKNNIKTTLEKAVEDELINKEEFSHMDPSDKKAAKFYSIYKVHKEVPEGLIPPLRPIISNCGSITENIGVFVQHHIKQFSKLHPSFLEDSPDFLRTIEDFNRTVTLEEGDLLVTIDVAALYTNIPTKEGVDACKEVLEKSDYSPGMQKLILDLLQLTLENNIFEFDSQLYEQKKGTAMGSRPAPDFANIFMAQKIDPKILEIGKDYIKLFKRFLDDIYIIFRGSTEELHNFLDDINKIHSTIKFTMGHTAATTENSCNCDVTSKLPFLDTATEIKDGKIIVDLYKKKTDRNQYLLPSSCHPQHVSNNIPYSLALRIVRICSEPETRDLRLSELKEMLLSRNYKPKIIDSAVERARAVPRVKALERVSRESSNSRQVFAVTYDPRLPSINSIVRRHWRTMTRDQYMAEVFPKPPLIAYKRPKNLRDLLIKAKVPARQQQRPGRDKTGMKQCQKCPICPLVKTCKIIRSTSSNYTHEVKGRFNCQTSNICYLVNCKKCGMQYVGETKNSAQSRWSQHRDYVTGEKLDKTVGEHFNTRGHTVADMEFVVLENFQKNSNHLRKERERFYINKFNSKHKGLNRNVGN